MQDDAVSFYYPENEGYAVKTLNDAEVAQAFNALLFPEDLSFLEKINSNHGVSHSLGGGVALEVNREIDMSVFYEPFRLIINDADIPTEFPIANLRILADEDDENITAFELNLMSITEYLDYAYIAVYNEAPKNPLGDFDFRICKIFISPFIPTNSMSKIRSAEYRVNRQTISEEDAKASSSFIKKPFKFKYVPVCMV